MYQELPYYIIIPKTSPEFEYEGQIQNNCVYGMAYFLNVINRESIIVFLRKEKNKPFVTIEFDYETSHGSAGSRNCNCDKLFRSIHFQGNSFTKLYAV